MGCVSERSEMLSFRPRMPAGDSLYELRLWQNDVFLFTSWRNMDLPIFKPLVLSLTAFNPPKPVALFVRRTEHML